MSGYSRVEVLHHHPPMKGGHGEVAKQIRGIYRRGQIYWYAKQVAGKRHHISLETTDLPEVIQRVRTLTDTSLLQPGTLLKFAVERYIRYRRDRKEWSLSSEYSSAYVLRSFAR